MIHKNIRRAVATVLLTLVMCSFLFVSTNAYSTMGAKMIGGVGQSGNKTRYYWVNPDVFNATWTQRAIDAMYDWCHTGTGCGVYTSVWFGRTTNQHSSVIDFQRNNDLGSAVYGKTTLYRTAGESNMITNPYSNKDNWTWAKCSINAYACNYGKSSTGQSVALTSAKKQAVFAHEIGHAFGLGDLTGNSNKNKLMYLGQFDCTVTKPTYDEYNGVNSIYGGYNP